MANVVAFDDVKATRTHRVVDGGKSAWRTNYMQPQTEAPNQPQAFLAECGPERVLRAHYHANDQFQIFVAGDGHMAKHPIRPFQVHFARAHTPYGPIVATEAGCAFLTLRKCRDGGAQYMPDKRAALEQVENRRPWQLTRDVEFPPLSGPIAVAALEGMHDECGLAAYALSVAPRATAQAPAARDSDGQYIVVLGGSILHEGEEKKATTIVFVQPHESPFTLRAGPEGAQAVALNFPRAPAAARIGRPGSAKAAEFKVWACVLCAFVYDEAAGLPEEGIPPGTRWADVPESWGCPDCSAKKADFEMVEI